jgi:hypothetical protein
MKIAFTIVPNLTDAENEAQIQAREKEAYGTTIVMWI